MSDGGKVRVKKPSADTMKLTKDEAEALVQGIRKHVAHQDEAPKEAKKKVLLQLPEDVHKQLRHRCIDEGATLGTLIERAIAAYLSKP